MYRYTKASINCLVLFTLTRHPNSWTKEATSFNARTVQDGSLIASTVDRVEKNWPTAFIEEVRTHTNST